MTSGGAGTLVVAGTGCGDGSPMLGNAPGISAGVYIGVASGVGVSEGDSRWKRAAAGRGECFDGTVLLRCTPLVVGVCGAGEIGLGAIDGADCFEETDTLLRTPALILLAPELERPRRLFGARPTEGVGGPLSTSALVFSSAPVPAMPIRKWSWFSMRKISTS